MAGLFTKNSDIPRDTFFEDAERNLLQNRLQALPEKENFDPESMVRQELIQASNAHQKQKEAERMAQEFLGGGIGFGTSSRGFNAPVGGVFGTQETRDNSPLGRLNLNEDEQKLLTQQAFDLANRFNAGPLLEADAAFRAHGKSGGLLKDSESGLRGADTFSNMEEIRQQNREREALSRKKNDIINSIRNSKQDRFSAEDIAAIMNLK